VIDTDKADKIITANTSSELPPNASSSAAQYTQDELVRIFHEDPERLKSLADECCRREHGSSVYVRGLIEYSNFCSMDCTYCGIRKSNAGAARYRMTPDEIIAAAVRAFGEGYRTFVLQGGEDPFFTDDVLATIVTNIKKQCRYEPAITLSAGVRSYQSYRRLKEAGADRYLLRFETSDPDLYAKLKNGESLSRRLDALRSIKALGFETGSGFMTGLPGESDETLCSNALLTQKIGCDMVGIGPFIPHPDTPLAGTAKPDLERTLRAVALVRMLLPRAHMPATTAAGSIDNMGREKMLSAGANVVMPNIGAVEYKNKYLLYPGKICLDEEYHECESCLAGRIASIGKKIDYSIGSSLR